jgi:hypothetical protein
MGHQAWYAEFLLEIDHKFLLRKTGANLIFKFALISLHIDPGFYRCSSRSKRGDSFVTNNGN